MNKFTFDSSWNQVKGKLRQKFGQLTDDDLNFAEGKGEELLGRLQQKLGLGEEQLGEVLGEMKASLDGGAVREKVEYARAKASEAADEFKSAASAKAEEFKAYTGEVYDHARERARTVKEDTEEYARRNPRQAVLSALAAGFVLGLLIRR